MRVLLDRQNIASCVAHSDSTASQLSSSQQLFLYFFQQSGGNLRQQIVFIAELCRDLLYFDETILTHQPHRCLQAKNVKRDRQMHWLLMFRFP